MPRQKVQTERDYFRRFSYAVVLWLVVAAEASKVSHALGLAVVGVGIVVGIISLWRNAP